MTTQTRGVWIVVKPNGLLLYDPRVRDEQSAWEYVFGWPSTESIALLKDEGYYAVRATVTWSKPT